MKIFQILILLAIMNASAQDNYNLIIGTYTNTCDSDGIYVYNFNTATGDFKQKGSSGSVENPSYLSVSPDRKYIYSVNEDGKKSTVSSFKYSFDGKVKSNNKKDSRGEDPCYIINDDKYVITANYTGGTIAVFGKNADGSLTDAKQLVMHSGSSVNKDRQESPHIHMVAFSPDRKYVLATDLGTDKVYIYNYNPKVDDKILVLNNVVMVKPGSGPRHITFSPNGIFMYLLNELNGSLNIYNYKDGTATMIQETTIASPEEDCINGAADIHLSRDGKFLYATNRGNVNTITVFKVHSNGRINYVQQTSTMGEGPRNFVIDPKDNFVLVGHQQSNEIVIFKRDKTTGMLTDTNKRIPLCSPVCLIFAENK